MRAREFDTVLIANRGEIAMRILRTARRLGLRVVTVYSDADRDMPHVGAADAAFRIGAAPAQDSYLDIDAILTAAARSGAQAVHPGYGFLSESAEFARRIEAAGLVFVGPPADAIDAMGNKSRAKAIVERAGAPVIPGFRAEGVDDAAILVAAERIGYPVMVKAAAGGGGRGMRLAQDAQALSHALVSARSEALAAFGSAELLLERALVRPRHIEVQVLADRHGHIVHLGERECSVQRRHQKVIEETPSPAVDDALRARLAATALAAASAVDYVGAGTVEFLLDEDGRHYFMEMNTRLQVEHAVTEMVTGLDLVEWQFRIAAGERLAFSQTDIRFDGHAIEARLCAETPEAGFLPQSGPVLAWAPPELGAALRIDHAVSAGGEISPHYDSMVAKFVAHGSNRSVAARKLARAIEATTLLGVATNQSFLLQCLRHPAFIAGATHTGFIGEFFARPTAEPLPPHILAAVLCATFMPPAPDALLQTGPVHASLILDQAPIEAELRAHGSRIAATFELDGARHDIGVEHLRIDDREPPLRRVICEIDAQIIAADFVETGEALFVASAGRVWKLARRDHLGRRKAVSSGDILAPMSGRVVETRYRPGDKVAAGDVIAVISAMKMEHSLCAEIAGTLAQLDVSVGDQTRAGQLLARIAPLAGEGRDE